MYEHSDYTSRLPSCADSNAKSHLGGGVAFVFPQVAIGHSTVVSGMYCHIMLIRISHELATTNSLVWFNAS